MDIILKTMFTGKKGFNQNMQTGKKDLTKEEVEEILSIGKGIKFRKDVYRRSSMHMDTRPSFGTIFEFITKI